MYWCDAFSGSALVYCKVCFVYPDSIGSGEPDLDGDPDPDLDGPKKFHV